MYAIRSYYESGRPVSSLKQLVVWGNHSPSMYADYRFVTSNGDSVKDIINDAAWNNDVFLPTVGKRGAAIIDARGLSSAASAANAAIDHVRDWVLGSDEWVTMGIPAPADNGYGIPEGLVFGLVITSYSIHYTKLYDPLSGVGYHCTAKIGSMSHISASTLLKTYL